jgi:tetratricopeptide (TPR) repeat protein
MQRALEIDPTSEFVKSILVGMPEIVRNYDQELAAAQKFFRQSKPSVQYFLAKGQLDQAQKSIEELAQQEPNDRDLPQQRALLYALRHDFARAEAEFPSILAKIPRNDPNIHHAIYTIACVYALEGKSDKAVKSLRETAATGFPCYPLFARDPYLNRIRQAPEFVGFLGEMKAQNERFRSEFSDNAAG